MSVFWRQLGTVRFCQLSGLDIAYYYDRNSNRKHMFVTGSQVYVTTHDHGANNKE